MVRNYQFGLVYINFMKRAKKFWALPPNEKDDYFSPQTHVNLIPVSKDAKFFGESDFNGLNSAISRNLEDY